MTSLKSIHLILSGCIAATAAHAALDLSKSTVFPSGGDELFNAPTGTQEANNGLKNGRSFNHTFRLEEDGFLNSIAIKIADDGPTDPSLTFDFQVFSLTDTNDATAYGNRTTLLSFDDVALGGTDEGGSDFWLVFDFSGTDSIALDASTGNEGYGFLLIGGSSGSNAFQMVMDESPTYTEGRNFEDSSSAQIIGAVYTSPIPEPSAFGLVAGVVAFSLLARRRR